MKIDTFFATFSRKPKKFPHDGCAPPRPRTACAPSAAPNARCRPEAAPRPPSSLSAPSGKACRAARSKNLSRKKAFLFGRFKILIYFCTTLKEECCCSSVVEHFLGKEEVTSSSLVNSSKKSRGCIDCNLFFCAVSGAKRGWKGASARKCCTHCCTLNLLLSITCATRK